MSLPKQIDAIFSDLCPKCKGEGSVLWADLKSSSGHDPGDSQHDSTKYPCDVCSGKGRVGIEK